MKIEKLFIPEWGIPVWVKGLSGHERIELLQADQVHSRAIIAAKCIVNDQGQRIFSDDDIHELAEKSAKALERVFHRGLHLSGLTIEATQEIEQRFREQPGRRFLFRLALALGRTIAELEALSSHELSEWMAFYSLEPWGEERADYRAALICKVIADVNRPRGQQPYKISDFMPFTEKPQSKPQSHQEQLDIMRALTAVISRKPPSTPGVS